MKKLKTIIISHFPKSHEKACAIENCRNFLFDCVEGIEVLDFVNFRGSIVRFFDNLIIF